MNKNLKIYETNFFQDGRLMYFCSAVRYKGKLYTLFKYSSMNAQQDNNQCHFVPF